ncbi:MAG: hypothetical protein ACTSRP_07380 [Candidatus Helarchaeota archaeon]
MKKIGFGIKSLLFVETIILTIFIISPITHELGHLIIGLWLGMRFVELKITIPLFVGENYIVMVGDYNFLFIIGGSFFNLIIGSIILLICKAKYNFIVVGIGLGLQLEGIIYFFYSIITGYGDFASVDISIAIIYFIINIVIMIILLQYIYQDKKGKEIIREFNKVIRS